MFNHKSVKSNKFVRLWLTQWSENVMKPLSLVTIIVIFALPSSVQAGPAAYGICQAGCAAVVTACYTAAGSTWGATLGASAPPTIIACNSAFGTCQAACAATLLLPTL